MIIDLTHTIKTNIPMYPGSEPPTLTPAGSFSLLGYRETRFAMGSHTGTHMDAPCHILQDGSGLEELPVSQFCGRAVVVDVSALPQRTITAAFLREQNGILRSADFVLFYTGWERRWNTEAFYEDTFPILDEESARYLVSCGLKGVGTDALSLDPLEGHDFSTHHILLGGGVVLLENLCLKKLLGRKDVMLFALPLKYDHSDGAPVRAIAEFRDFPEKEMELQ